MSQGEFGAARREDPARVATMGAGGAPEGIVESLDAPTRALVRLAAIISAGDEATMRAALVRAAVEVPAEWVEELILQSYLFAGFPRTLNAMREWRRASGRKAPKDDPGAHIDEAPQWEADGMETCARVYGPFYERLRPNIAALHPALDMWTVSYTHLTLPTN